MRDRMELQAHWTEPGRSIIHEDRSAKWMAARKVRTHAARTTAAKELRYTWGMN